MTSDLRAYGPQAPEAETGPSQDPFLEEIRPVGVDEAAAGGPASGPYLETTLEDARRVYVQSHYERFAGLFARCDASNGVRLSFGLAPFLFGGLWFIYRKMYVEGLLLLVAGLSLSAYTEISRLSDPEAFSSLVTTLQFSLTVLAGLFGKALYWKATDRRIAKAMRLYPREPGQALAWLDESGGVNGPVVLVTAVLMIILYGAMTAVAIRLINF